jgi:anti-anti-sigma regulatory factor/HAMP domain-containing protein
MSLRLRLILLFSLNLVLMAILGGVTLTQQYRMNERSQLLSSIQLPASDLLGSLGTAFATYRSLQSDHVDGIGSSISEGKMDAIEARIVSLLNSYRKLVQGDEQRQILEKVEQDWAGYRDHNDRLVLPASRAGDQLLARSQLATIRPLFDKMTTDIQRLKQRTQAQADTLVEEVQNAYQSALSISIAVMVLALMLSAITGFSQAIDLSNQVDRLRAATERVNTEQLNEAVPVESKDELGKLAQAFNQMLERLQGAQRYIAEQQRTLAVRNSELEYTLNELQNAAAEQKALRAEINRLSLPVVRVEAGVLVLPLVGTLDSERGELLLNNLLKAVEQERARHVIIDVTGVPVVDTAVAQNLIQAAEASRLLGAQSVLVGIRPELAQTLVALGVDLSHLVTRADLASGLAYVRSANATLRAVGKSDQFRRVPNHISRES